MKLLLSKVARLQNFMSAHGNIFKSVTGFYKSGWEILCQSVVPILEASARSTGEMKRMPVRPAKLNLPDRLL